MALAREGDEPRKRMMVLVHTLQLSCAACDVPKQRGRARRQAALRRLHHGVCAQQPPQRLAKVRSACACAAREQRVCVCASACGAPYCRAASEVGAHRPAAGAPSAARPTRPRPACASRACGSPTGALPPAQARGGGAPADHAAAGRPTAPPRRPPRRGTNGTRRRTSPRARTWRATRRPSRAPPLRQPTKLRATETRRVDAQQGRTASTSWGDAPMASAASCRSADVRGGARACMMPSSAHSSNCACGRRTHTRPAAGRGVARGGSRR